MSPARDCHDLAKRIATGLRLMADILEDPDMDDETEQLDEHLPSAELLNPLADVETKPEVAPIEPVEAPVRRGPRPIAVVSESKFKAITGLTGDEFDRVASLPPDEFEAAVNIGIRPYLDARASKSMESASPPASEAAELLEAAE
jgi:hypothetical protein